MLQVNPVNSMGDFVRKLSRIETDIAVRRDIPVWLNYAIT